MRKRFTNPEASEKGKALSKDKNKSAAKKNGICRSPPFRDGFAARALQSLTHGSLRASKSAADRPIQRDVLLLVNNTREISKRHFYTAHMIDAAAGAVHIF
jgi:hypothetical protein